MNTALLMDVVLPNGSRTHAVLEELPIGLAILDPQTRLIYSNRRYSDLRGIPSDLDAWVKAIHPEDRERVLRSRTKALLHYEPWAETYRFLHSDDTTVWVSARAVPLHAGPAIAGIVVTLEDVTPIKSAEEKLHRANEELQMHAGRLEQEVQHRMAKADEALYELERLGYSIVDDMRAPLRTVQSYAQILAEEYARSVGRPG